MINGVNTVDFTFAKDSKTTISSALPQARSELITVFQYACAKPEITMSARNLTKANEMEPPGLERVHVQRLQTHTQLRNNKWTYQNFYSNAATAATAAMDTVIDASYKTQYNHNNKTNSYNNNNNINTTNNNNNNLNKNIIENKSALFKCNNEEQLGQQQQQQLHHQQQQQQPQQPHQLNFGVAAQVAHARVGEPKQNFSDNFMITGGGDKIITLDSDNGNARPNYYRTKDQENAFRRIEDVHNYAKLKRYGNSNESSDGSTRDFDDDDDEEDDDDDIDGDDDDDHDNGNVAGVPTGLAKDFHIQMPKSHVSAGKNHVVSAVAGGYVQSKSLLAKNYLIRTPSKSSSIEDTDAIVDVETVAGEHSEQQLMQSPPAHHARRPMNAFLIFCKRHRAIVKDRYKSLENRAITKILGDWWASLDGDEKECFTKLAQQNKDAFFSAHPNFKWYKLPAPPLRTLSTRPSNAERTLEDNELEQAEEQPKMFIKNQSGGFFKLADETQMGELNSLMNDQNKNECLLQKALSETTHFFSAHMPSSVDSDMNTGQNEKRNIKRRAITENGFSSNSSEDDQLPKKSSRSCKGKIYQKLVSSGQIAPITKKTRLTKVTNAAANFANELQGADYNYAVMHGNAGAHEGFNATSYLRAMDIRSNKAKRTVSESDASHHLGEHIGQFDLEEKIKQLPALSLDAYLQRKRNTKKKKKFTTRKRTSNSVSLPITDHHRPLTMAVAPKSEIRNYVQQQQHQQHQQQAVGSQKRKARKESITRRDVSAIESEVASLMPLTSNYELPNGHFYYNENPNGMNVATTTVVANTQTVENAPAKTSNVNAANSGDVSRAYSNYADSITTTSDLFILAEVAAKRTELTNSN